MVGGASWMIKLALKSIPGDFISSHKILICPPGELKFWPDQILIQHLNENIVVETDKLNIVFLILFIGFQFMLIIYMLKNEGN